MTQSIVHWLFFELVRNIAYDYGRVDKVVDPVWASVGVQAHVPVGPPGDPVLKNLVMLTIYF